MAKKNNNEEQTFRVKTPRGNQVIGKVIELHGGKRMKVQCSDGKLRLCRIPGRKSRIWVKRDNYVLVEPWEIEGDEKGDVVWKYRGRSISWLRKKGYLKDLD